MRSPIETKKFFFLILAFVLSACARNEPILKNLADGKLDIGGVETAVVNHPGGGGDGEKPVDPVAVFELSKFPEPVAKRGDLLGQVLTSQTGSTNYMELSERVAESEVGWSRTFLPSECASVPSGYQPIAKAKIELLDKNLLVIDSTKSDVCGLYLLKVTIEGRWIRVSAPGLKTFYYGVDAVVFDTSNPNYNSMISTSSHISLAALYKLNDKRLGFSLVDSESGKAILGFDRRFLNLQVNQKAKTIQGMNYSAVDSDAVISLVLDSSGSMGDAVEGTTKERLLSKAGQRFLDFKADADQVGVVIFSDAPHFMDQGLVSTQLKMKDSGGNSVQIKYPGNGFFSDLLPGRFIMSAYSPSSEIYGGVDGLHADVLKAYGNIRAVDPYSFLGGTALFDAVDLGLSKVEGARGTSRSYVVVFTDGQENSSKTANLNSVIAHGQSSGTPVYSIGFGQDGQIDKSSLQNLANQTGGSFKQVQGVSDVVSAFEGIQTGIRFEYLLDVADPVVQGDKIKLELDFVGFKQNKEITVGF